MVVLLFAWATARAIGRGASTHYYFVIFLKKGECRQLSCVSPMLSPALSPNIGVSRILSPALSPNMGVSPILSPVLSPNMALPNGPFAASDVVAIGRHCVDDQALYQLADIVPMTRHCVDWQTLCR